MTNLPSDSSQPVSGIGVSSTTPIQGDISSQSPPVLPQGGPSGGSVSKEHELFGSKPPENLPLEAVGKEMELPKEVSAVGVSLHPQVIQLPPPIVKLGVQPAGVNVPVQPMPTIKLPVTDDAVLQGIKKRPTESVRWLAEWCVRRLKQIHMKLTVVRGHVTRVPIS